MIESALLYALNSEATPHHTSTQSPSMLHTKTAGRFDTAHASEKKTTKLYDVFTDAKVQGRVKFGWINFDNGQKNETDLTTTIIGAEFGFQTKAINGFSFNILANTIQKVPVINPDDAKLSDEFLDKNKKSFTNISQASINYKSKDFESKLGRISIETPWANSDDIRLAPDTFEGAWTQYDNDNFTYTSYYLNRWAGFDSADENYGQNEFHNLVADDSFGMLGVSLTYHIDASNEASLWFDYIDKMTQILYAEITGDIHANSAAHIEYGFQAANMRTLSTSNIEASMLGGMGIYHYKKLFLGGSYNYAFIGRNKLISNGFGGSPYYSSFNESTLAGISENAPGEDISAYRISLGYTPLETLTCEIAYGDLDSKDMTYRIHESNAIVTYEAKEGLFIEASFTKFDANKDADDFNRALLRIDYNF